MKLNKKYLLVSLILVLALVLNGCVLSDEQADEGEYVPPKKNVIEDDITGLEILPEDKTVLDLSKRNLTEFPKDILSRNELKKLILSRNNIKTLPAEIGELVNLEELYLDNNQLDGALVAEIRKMPKLRILDASNNNMTGIPAEIGQLSNLTTLNYANNKLDTMPNEIENIKNNLLFLDLRGNNYSPEMLQQIEEKLPNTQVTY